MFEHYSPTHRERLNWSLRQREWQDILAGVDLDKIRSETLSPPPPPSQLTGAAHYLLQRNRERVEKLL
ncbi:MAG: hypothetical protein ACK40X_12560, partial [Armatimonadota bacterium]